MAGREQLKGVACALVAAGKGILAADESTGTIGKRFQAQGIECTPETRAAYREMLFTTAGLGDHISGVILYDETIRQTAQSGKKMLDILNRQQIIPGIKVDQGAKPLAHFDGETLTEGLDGLRERLEEYRALGAQFTKWRAVIRIGPGIPTDTCLKANAQAHARFAALSQEAGLVPIVEPEVLMDGGHDVDDCFAVSVRAVRFVFDALYDQRVMLEGMLLKPNMVLPGKDSSRQVPVEEVARATLECLRQAVPVAVPGIVFLSGGQSDIQATQHLNAMNQLSGSPWELSFSYGRALQSPALKAWNGQPENVAAGQKALIHRAKCNSAARFGQYSDVIERAR